MRFRRKLTPPDPLNLPPAPENVRLKYWDGSEDPVELTYVGLDDRGIHQWVAVPTSPLVSRYAQILVDKMPPKTGIRLRW